MNGILENSIKYSCSCGILNPLNKLFFCRHCPNLRCGFCVFHEVESHFCSNCLENIPSSEARHKRNCCANCFDCPCCGHTLSARATTVPIFKKLDEKVKETDAALAAEAAKPVATKKMYYLSCLACRWTSRDVGIPDQGVASGTWPDSECLYQSRFNSFLEYYQSVIMREKQEKQEFMRRKTTKINKFPNLTDRTGLTVSLIRRQIGWNDNSFQMAKVVQVAPATADDAVEDISPDIFTEKPNLRKITTIHQRHSQPSDQPTSVSNLYPQRRSLWIKRSLRCRQCEHNLIKPEYHPTSIKYRIQLFASYHVPEVILVRREQLVCAGKRCSILVKIINPTMYDITVTIMELFNQDDDDSVGGSGDAKNFNEIETKSIIKDNSFLLHNANAKLELPDSSFEIGQRDDSKEFDEESQNQREEHKFIVWRKGNKVLIRLYYTPFEVLQIGDAVTVGFVIQNTYVNTVSNNTSSSSEKKEPITHALNSNVFINVGAIQADN